MKGKDNKKVLLHTCCAVCSGHPVKLLRQLGYEPAAYFFNPNIYPDSEHSKRLEEQKKLCKALDCELIAEDYKPDLYNEIMTGFEHHNEGGERCKRCFELRLLKTVQKAQELKIPNYTTTMSVSPHKNFKIIKETGNFFAESFNINFLALDFKKQNGFFHTNKIAEEFNLYRQNYCGCINSFRKKDEN